MPEGVAAVLGSSEDSSTALLIAVGSAACSGSEDSFTAIATQVMLQVSLLWLQHRTQAATMHILQHCECEQLRHIARA